MKIEGKESKFLRIGVTTRGWSSGDYQSSGIHVELKLDNDNPKSSTPESQFSARFELAQLPKLGALYFIHLFDHLKVPP